MTHPDNNGAASEKTGVDGAAPDAPGEPDGGFPCGECLRDDEVEVMFVRNI